MSEPYGQISGSTRLAAVIGHPVRHSLSPAMHNAVFSAAGLDWRFVAFDVVAGGAAEAIGSMRTLGIGGFAVTMPHKFDAALAVDEVDAAARALRAVNTVVLRDDGSTFGASTDGQGFVDSVTASGVPLLGASVVVLGAGGAARSIIDSLGRAGVADIVVINRTPANAASAAELAPMARVGSVDDVAAATLLVNTTSIGMGSSGMGSSGNGVSDLPIDPGVLRSDLAVADIVYHPLETALLAAARAVGAPVVDGLGMLVHQAVLQQRLWTGQTPDPAVLRAAAEAELARR